MNKVTVYSRFIKIKIFKIIKSKNNSLFFYTLGTLAFFIIPTFFMMFLKKTSVAKFTFDITFSVVMVFYIIGFLIDIYNISKKIYNGFILKLLFSLFFTTYFYISFYQAESIAKKIIYYLTNTNPDYFPTAISVITLYKMPESLFYTFFSKIFIFIFIVLFAFPLLVFILDKFKKQNLLFHLIFFIIGLIIFSTSIFFIFNSKFLNDYLNDEFFKKEIIINSYYLNRTCKNIDNNVYIKYLEGNIISVSNVHKNSFLEYTFPKNITFKNSICKSK